MAKIGIVGLGAMGLGIAQVYAQAGHEVRATDTRPEARRDALLRLSEMLAPRVAAGKLAAEDLAALLAAITVVETPEEIGDADLVVEAIVEEPGSKKDLLARLERVVPGAVLATNTSALSIGGLSRALADPSRLVGLHFFNPAPVMKLVELVATPDSAAEAVIRTRALTEEAGKTVITCADSPGFIVNRCARPFYGEALALAEEGRWPSEIDGAMVGAGYRMGPFSLIDLIGADVNLAATQGMYDAMERNPRYYVFPLLRQQVESGNLGRKSGNGFLFPSSPDKPPADADAIVRRIEATLANEAASLVEAGGATADDIDMAMKLGMNFPRGPFESARAHGIDTVLADLATLEAAAPPELKGRYVASPVLKSMA